MADVRASFTPIEDVSTGAGVALHKAVEGDAAAGKNSHPVLIAKNDSGNLVYPRANANRELVVTTDSQNYACLTEEGGVAGSGSFQNLAVIVLQDGYTYKKIGFMGSSFRDAVYEVVWVDDVGGTNAETILATFRTGSGQYTHSQEMDCLEFTAGTTAELRIRGKNLNTTSDIDGMISTLEVQP